MQNSHDWEDLREDGCYCPQAVPGAAPLLCGYSATCRHIGEAGLWGRHSKVSGNACESS